MANTLSLHDALPIFRREEAAKLLCCLRRGAARKSDE
jgi:hypothetical protein